MFFILSKLLHFLISPIIWVFGLLIAMLLVKSPRLKRKLLISSLVVLYFFSNAFIVDEVFRWYEERTPSYKTMTTTYDIALVLGGFTTYDTESGLEGFHESTDRFLHALHLYKTGKVQKIMLIGGSGSIAKPEEKEGEIMAGFLTKIGVPKEAIIIENQSKNTRENALYAAEILKSYPPTSKLLLITSGYHMPRAKRCFQKAGVAFTPYSVDYYSGERKFVFDHLLLPDIQAITRWRVILHEWVGFITYKMLGYV
ncbi:MAG TPA: YdcF family protein [Vicingaceae bacterium]|nr:YdcF family protein [Vicingaceae bacterium]